MTKRSLTKDILNTRFCPFPINNVRTTITAPPVIERVNFLSCMAEEQNPLCTSPPMVCLPALLGCKEQICVQSLPERAYFIGLLLSWSRHRSVVQKTWWCFSLCFLRPVLCLLCLLCPSLADPHQHCAGSSWQH